MEDKVRIIRLGGQDENEKNLTAVEINDDIFVIQCGLRMPEKAGHGIDYIIPRFDYLVANKNKIRGYFLTKGHDNLIGGLPHLLKVAPAKVFCTDVTLAYLKAFIVHNKIDVKLDVDVVEPCDQRIIAGRKIRFFQTACNMARSFGLAISTNKGNVVFADDFVIDNNCDSSYVTNTKMLSEVSGEETLCLMLGSRYAENPGYTNPKYKLVPLVEQYFKESTGRIIVILQSPDVYNIEMIIKYGIKMGRKVIAYDDDTREIYYRVSNSKTYKIPPQYIASADEAGRLRQQDVMIIMAGFGNSIFNKLALFANGENEDKRIRIMPGDTFLIGLHSNPSTEVLFTESINELYKNDGINIVYFNNKQYKLMFPSEEDLKTLLSIFRPKYYVPIDGSFRQLLANAKIALGMGIGLNHMNVFILDNGMVLEIDEKGAHITQEKILTGDMFVAGINVGDNDNKTIEERKVLGDDGIIVLATTYSLSQRKIVLGPDIQTRGLIFVKENDTLMKEINRLFVNVINEELAKPNPSRIEMENVASDLIFKTIRRITLKTPMIIPEIIEIK